MKPYTITGLYNCGKTPNAFDDGETHVAFIGIDDGRRTVYVRASLPVQRGSALHRIACAVTGYTLPEWDFREWSKISDTIVGKPLLADVTCEGGEAFLRRVDVFPQGPRVSVPPTVFTTQSPELGGKLGAPVRCGGDIVRRADPLPPVPTPRTKPIAWSVSELKRAKFPDGLPSIVIEYAERSAEFQALESTARR